MIQKKWFSVEHLKDGSIGKVTEVEAKGRSGAVVRFYEAADAADACTQAAQWFARSRAQSAAANRRRRDARRADALCTDCGGTPTPGFVRCEGCRNRSAADMRLSRQGVNRRGPLLSPEEAYARYRSNPTVRLATVLRRFDALGPVAFRAWLVSKIPAMQQTQGEWHPPLAYEPMAQAAE